MIICVNGTSLRMISVAVIPSISGILISIKRTSGLTSLEISIASRPVLATPTTSTSASNCNNFLMFSLVSEMSSTITTRIFSVSTTDQLQIIGYFHGYGVGVLSFGSDGGTNAVTAG